MRHDRQGRHVHNFGAGPSTLPVAVLEEARDELVDFAGTGMSLVELSHRSPEYRRVHDEALALAAEVAGAPSDFEVLALQGGATLQFAMVPLNLLDEGEEAGYVVSGSWAKKALADARTVANAHVAWNGTADGFRRMPAPTEPEVGASARYLHVTSNETIEGLRMAEWPDVGVPLVADVSSDFLSRPIPWHRFNLVYGGAQKNLGPAGVTLSFVRRSALRSGVTDRIPSYLRYAWHAEAGSLANTPPMFSIYLMGKVLRRLRDRGGVAGLERESAEKASILYRVIDESEDFYRSSVEPAHRSHMNVVFRLPDAEREERFLSEAASRGFVGLRGHRSVGGCRASLYAALPVASAAALGEFMAEFRRSG
ncbi:MAG: 3-phosphoserine/phosphohydroxythreonine transaminase [Acidimicrobiia bacterium]